MKVFPKTWVVLCCVLFARCVLASPGLEQGNQLVEQGQYEQAIEVYRGLLDREDGKGVISAHIAYAYLQLGQADDAEKWMDRAIEKDPRNARFYDRRAGIYNRQPRIRMPVCSTNWVWPET